MSLIVISLQMSREMPLVILNDIIRSTQTYVQNKRKLCLVRTEPIDSKGQVYVNIVISSC